MVRRKVVGALAGAIVFYALSDILLWQRIFEEHGLYRFDGQYQTGHVAVLVGLIAVGMVLLYDAGPWAIWYGLALYTLAYSGLEDVLYYILDSRPIPNLLPWLDENRLILFKPVTHGGLLASSALWLSGWVAVLLLAPRCWPHIAARVRGLPRLATAASPRHPEGGP
jgi:hypothetical protein